MGRSGRRAHDGTARSPPVAVEPGRTARARVGRCKASVTPEYGTGGDAGRGELNHRRSVQGPTRTPRCQPGLRHERDRRDTAAMTRAAARLWALRTVFRTVGPLAPGLAARWAETLFCTPPRHQARPGGRGVPRERAPLQRPVGGGELAVWEWGQGPLVVLVHGWGSRAARMGALAAALTRRGIRVVAYDGPAHGRSAGRFASLPEFARALGAVGAASGPLHGLVGHSLGGAAVAMALGHGLEARRVVLLAPPADVRIFSDIFAETLAVPRRGPGDDAPEPGGPPSDDVGGPRHSRAGQSS